jgi:hypothetical protein
LSASSINEGYSLPALLVGKVGDYGLIETDLSLESGKYAFSIDNKYICLGADNNLYIVYPPNIAAVGTDMHELQEESRQHIAGAAADIVSRASKLSHKAWSKLAKNVMRAEGSPSTAAYIASCIPAASSLDPIFPSQDGLDALEEQKKRIKEIKIEIEILRGDKKMAKASRKRAQAFAKAGSLMDQAAGLRDELESYVGGSWREFLNIIKVLESNSAIISSTDMQLPFSSFDEEAMANVTYDFSPLGLVSRELRGSNELWMALALTHQSLQTLAAPQLAAVISALVAEDAVSRISMIGSAYPPSSVVIETIEQLDEVRRELSLSQLEAGIDFPTPLDYTLAGVVEAWASGLGWNEVTGDCDLDDGDVARLLMRTVDTLRQAAFCEHLLPPLRSAAKTAARRMNRPPISDLIT